jgi:hypothetical protein
MKKTIIFFLLFFFIIGIGNSIEIGTNVKIGSSNGTSFYNNTALFNATSIIIDSTNINFTFADQKDVFTENLGLLYFDTTEAILNQTDTLDQLNIFDFVTSTNITILNITGSLTNFSIKYSGNTTGLLEFNLPSLSNECNYGVFNILGKQRSIDYYVFPVSLQNFTTCNFTAHADNRTNGTYEVRIQENDANKDSNLPSSIVTSFIYYLKVFLT